MRVNKIVSQNDGPKKRSCSTTSWGDAQAARSPSKQRKRRDERALAENAKGLAGHASVDFSCVYLLASKSCRSM
jgi:hypothetical protein